MTSNLDLDEAGFASLFGIGGPVDNDLRERAQRVRDMAERLAPRGTGEHGGHIADSIVVKRITGGRQLHYLVGSDNPHASFQELGAPHINVPPQPFLRPALDSAR